MENVLLLFIDSWPVKNKNEQKIYYTTNIAFIMNVSQI